MPIGVMPPEIGMAANRVVPDFYFGDLHSGYGLTRWWMPCLDAWCMSSISREVLTSLGCSHTMCSTSGLV